MDGVAQSVERRLVTPNVASSNLTAVPSRIEPGVGGAPWKRPMAGATPASATKDNFLKRIYYDRKSKQI